MQVVIVGNGVAGMEAALELRRRSDAQITLVSEESDHFFSRTALMYVMCGQLSHRDIEPLERDAYERLGFRRVRGRAVGVDVANRELKLAGDIPSVPYDALLLACGSRPRPGPWPGSDLRGVGHFVTLQDLEWLEQEVHGQAGHGGRPPRPDAHLAMTTDDSPFLRREAAADRKGSTARRPVVIGGGLIGIEVVETMLAAGLQPTFLIREEWFWPIALDKRESKWIARELANHGVDVRLDHNVERIEGDDDGNVCRVVTSSEAISADVVVVAIGVVPNTEWLAESGVERDDRFGGITVNEQLETNIPNVYAAGDCATVEWFNGARRPEQLWYTARDQGRIVGRRMAGQDTEYRRGTWYNSAKLMDIEYTTAGLVNMNLPDEDEWYFEEQGRVRSTNRIVVQGDRVVGFNFLGRRWDHEVLIQWIHERRRLSWVIDHLAEASFDTEFVPPLQIPSGVRSTSSTRTSQVGE